LPGAALLYGLSDGLLVQIKGSVINQTAVLGVWRVLQSRTANKQRTIFMKNLKKLENISEFAVKTRRFC
jgi:hypothetical protein